MTAYFRPDLDCYETGEWDVDRGDSTDCPQCGGSGIDWPGSLWEPEEPCTLCDGSGVADCNCPQCGGSGWRPGSYDPDEWCETCDGLGVIDCNCPGLCAIHRAHALPELGEPAPWTDPWAGYTEPPF